MSRGSRIDFASGLVQCLAENFQISQITDQAERSRQNLAEDANSPH